MQFVRHRVLRREPGVILCQQCVEKRDKERGWLMDLFILTTPADEQQLGPVAVHQLPLCQEGGCGVLAGTRCGGCTRKLCTEHQVSEPVHQS